MPDAIPAAVFVVDDDVGLLRLIEKSLRREGYSTATAASAGEALDWLRNHRPDLMLLDLRLKDAGGEQVIDQLASAQRLVPFVIITGQGDERVAVDMMKRGALDYLVKDANFIELVPTIVRRALGQLERDRRLASAESERKHLEQQILEISEREQRRIGQDLHDGLGQHLTGIELMTQSLEQKLAAKAKPEAGQAAKIAQHVRDAIRQTRSLARGLSPVEMDANGLMSALHELAGNVQNMFRVECVFRCDKPVLVEENTVATHLFRIAQEAVSNAVKHGKASRVEIALNALPNELTLAVKDNGSGIPADVGHAKGMGLRIMQYRAAVVGGSLTVQGKPNGGTTVVCSIPQQSVAVGNNPK
jgi:signal transduction histidine kinase